MALGTRTFRIFVSSTFADLIEERNALQDRVFPRLRDYCLQQGTRFQAIDLRWGVSEEAGLDQQTISICLTEIDRCRRTSPRPNFIVLLGDRYGWLPPPPQIPEYEFDEIVSRISTKEETRLREWYRLDKNSVVGRRANGAPVHDYYLRPREGEFKHPEKWNPIEEELRSILKEAVRDMPLEAADRLKYESSATEQEIYRGALRSPEQHVFCFLRTITGLPSDESARDYVNLSADGRPDDDARARLTELKDKLKAILPDNCKEYAASWVGTDSSRPITLDHLDQLCDDVYTVLRGIIEDEIDRLEDVDPVDREVAAHDEFRDERARFFLGREKILERIDSHIAQPSGTPLIVHGASGSGKSAVMARAAQLAKERHPGVVMSRFVGATPESSNVRALLDGLVRDISRRYGGDETTVPADYRELVRDFGERLALAVPERPLIIFIDAVDQLSAADGGRNMAWLPGALPPNVSVIVSTTPGDTFKALEGRPPQSFAKLDPMETGDAAPLLELWLEDAGRTLQEDQGNEIVEKFAVERLPLWLKLAFEEARLWRSTDEFPDIDLPASVSEIIRKRLFGRLDDPGNHGKVLVSHALAYLAAAKNGLSEDEMIEALSIGGHDGEVLKDFFKRSPRSPRVDVLPVVVWSRLFFDLEPYLTERVADGASLLAFYHRQLGEAAAEEYLSGQEGVARHAELAAYFGWQRLELQGQDSPVPNLRQMSELPYQQTKGRLWDEVFRTLTDFYFLEKKATHAQPVIESTDAQGKTANTYTGIYQIRDDYALALKAMPGGDVVADTDTRRRIIVTGTDYGNGEGYVLRCPHCGAVHKFLDKWRGDAKFACPGCNGPLKVNDFVVPTD